MRPHRRDCRWSRCGTSGRLTRVVTDRGEDVTSSLARRDGVAAKRLRAVRHSRICQRSRADPRTQERRGLAPSQVLLLTGWTDYAFSSDNVAADQRGWSLDPPRLEVRGRAASGAPLVADVGIPVGRPQTIVVDIGDAAAKRPEPSFA